MVGLWEVIPTPELKEGQSRMQSQQRGVDLKRRIKEKRGRGEGKDGALGVAHAYVAGRAGHTGGGVTHLTGRVSHAGRRAGHAVSPDTRVTHFAGSAVSRVSAGGVSSVGVVAENHVAEVGKGGEILKPRGEKDKVRS
jgi:hypothetical protein